jgi:hypothetical protein
MRPGKRTFSIIAVGLAVAASVLGASAADTRSRSARAERLEARSCLALERRIEKTIKEVGKFEEKLRRSQDQADREYLRYARAIQKRQGNDSELSIRWDMLEASADSDAKKTAVKEFREAVEKAIQSRRNAIDALAKKRSDALEKDAEARRTFVRSAAAAVRSDLETLHREIEGSCTTRQDAASAYNRVVEKLMGALASLKDEAAQPRTTASSRLAGTDEIDAEFRNSIEQARENLREAWSRE